MRALLPVWQVGAREREGEGEREREEQLLLGHDNLDVYFTAAAESLLRMTKLLPTLT